MKISEPNELIRLCFTYGIHDIPVKKQGKIRGRINKKDLVRYLRKSENFERSVVQTIEELSRPTGEDFLDTLQTKLREGDISGLPILGSDGELKRVITPGILRSQDELGEFLQETQQREVFETLLKEFPLPVTLSVNDRVVYENHAHEEFNLEEGSWESIEEQAGATTLQVHVPAVLHTFMQTYLGFRKGRSMDLRPLMQRLETGILKEAQASSSSVSRAAERVGLPRQTFHYRWKNRVETPPGEQSA